MSDRPMAPEHHWTEDGLSFAVHDNGILLGNTERFGRELLRVVAERDEAREALQEMEDAHSEETGTRCRAEDERDALGKALLAIWRGPTLVAFDHARVALRDAGLLPQGQEMHDEI